MSFHGFRRSRNRVECLSMLLAIDVGNTQTVFGLFEQAELAPGLDVPGKGKVETLRAGVH